VTPACVSALGLTLLLYLAAALLFQRQFLLRRDHGDRWGHRLLLAGLILHSVGLGFHFALSGRTPMSSMLIVVSLITVALLAAVLLLERFTGARHLSLVAAPLAFLALLYALVMPVRFDASESLLLRYPWLGIHVLLTLVGDICFAVAFCGALAYVVQGRSLKRGRLNRYLPPLDASAATTWRFAAAGFSLYTLGLVMGVVWLYGAPGEYLRPRDAKILMALPTWAVFAAYLYRRGVNRQHGSRLKWLVIAGFLLALANLLVVRHQFTPQPSAAGQTTMAGPPAAAGRLPGPAPTEDADALQEG
jgi:ABC-type transport system involved in cytochrome c biogenesis permease subunit